MLKNNFDTDSRETKNAVLVAEVHAIDNHATSLFKPLGDALAPLGFYITPIVQEVNYINHIRGKAMSSIKLVEIIQKKLEKINVELEIVEKGSKIRVYADKEVYKNSTYSDIEFVQKIFKAKKLPVVFRII